LDFLPRYGECSNFINADLIARGLSPLNPDTALLTAGRLFLIQIKNQISVRNTFAYETTLAGQSHLNLIKTIKKSGYMINLYFLWIPSVELAEKRIYERVLRGGHNVSADVVRRRFHRGLANLFNHYMPLLDYCAIFDNSSFDPILVYERRKGIERIVHPANFKIIRQQAGRSEI
jgi:predicted ABC-type ATPase